MILADLREEQERLEALRGRWVTDHRISDLEFAKLQGEINGLRTARGLVLDIIYGE